MKKIPWCQIVLLLAVLCAHLGAQVPSEIRASAEAVNLSKKKSKDSAYMEETWTYRIKLENTTGKDWTDLEVRYRIYSYNELNPDHKPSVPLSFNEQKKPLESLKSRATATLDTTHQPFTNPIKGAFGPVKYDKEILQGIWIRIYTKEGQEVGELIKPSSLAKKMPWQ